MIHILKNVCKTKGGCNLELPCVSRAFITTDESDYGHLEICKLINPWRWWESIWFSVDTVFLTPCEGGVISERFPERVERTPAHESNESGSESVPLLPGCHQGCGLSTPSTARDGLEMQSWGPTDLTSALRQDPLGSWTSQWIPLSLTSHILVMGDPNISSAPPQSIWEQMHDI